MTPSEEKNLCSKCLARPATNHICFGGSGQAVDLCDECLRTDKATEVMYAASFIDEAKSATCCYCGGFPCGGGTDTLSQITGGPPQNRWMCMPCSAEYHSSTQRAFESVPGNLTTEEQIARIKEIGADIDSHMAAFVARRDN